MLKLLLSRVSTYAQFIALCSALSGGCGDDPKKGAASCNDGECSADPQIATDSKPVKSSNSKDAGAWRSFSPPPPDAGDLDAWVPDKDEPLQARIQVNGTDLPCGACSVIAAQAQGGKRPYTYKWSDPALSGPGPHRVCPTAPTSYSLTVTDDSSLTSTELTIAHQSVDTSADITCVADAGLASTFQGCGGGSSFEPDMTGVINCDLPTDGGMAPPLELASGTTFVTSKAPPIPLIGGQTYEFSYDHLLPIVLGEGVNVEVFGAMNDKPCERLEKLFEFDLNGTWHQTMCFKPARSYDRAISVVHLKEIWFWFELGQVGTLCTANACSQP
jgi:hypothetical protein